MLSYQDFLVIKDIVLSSKETYVNTDVKVLNKKTNHDLLTYNDLKMEEYLLQNIKNKFPVLRFLTEETHSETVLEGETIVIDPIDGTCNYAVKNNLCGTQLALFEGHTCYAAIIYLPYSNEIFYAYKDNGCYLNEERIYLDNKLSSHDGYLLISDYYDNIPISIDKQFDLIKKLQKHYLKTRHFGAACYDFASLLKKQAISYVTYYHYIWDIAPGLFLIKEAGGYYKNLDNALFSYKNIGIAISNNEENLNTILEEFRK